MNVCVGWHLVFAQKLMQEGKIPPGSQVMMNQDGSITVYVPQGTQPPQQPQQPGAVRPAPPPQQHTQQQPQMQAQPAQQQQQQQQQQPRYGLIQTPQGIMQVLLGPDGRVQQAGPQQPAPQQPAAESQADKSGAGQLTQRLSQQNPASSGGPQQQQQQGQAVSQPANQVQQQQPQQAQPQARPQMSGLPPGVTLQTGPNGQLMLVQSQPAQAPAQQGSKDGQGVSGPQQGQGPMQQMAAPGQMQGQQMGVKVGQQQPQQPQPQQQMAMGGMQGQQGGQMGGLKVVNGMLLVDGQGGQGQQQRVMMQPQMQPQQQMVMMRAPMQQPQAVMQQPVMQQQPMVQQAQQQVMINGQRFIVPPGHQVSSHDSLTTSAMSTQHVQLTGLFLRRCTWSAEPCCFAMLETG